MKKILQFKYMFNRIKVFIINNLINNSKFIFNIYSHYLLRKSIKKTYLQIIQNNIPREHTLTAEKLLELIQESPKEKNICNILCSGVSILNTISRIDSSEYVMGLNYSGLIYPKPDIHFLEHAHLKTEIDKLRTNLFAKSLNKLGNNPLVWKNISGGQVFYSVVKSHFYNNNKFLVDYTLPSFNHKYKNISKESLYKLLNSSYKFGVPQYANSLISLIGIASKIFKRINIYGCDMGGPRFYEDSNFICPEYLSNEDLNLLNENVNYDFSEGYKKYGKLNDLRSINSLKELIPIAENYLTQKGIIIKIIQ